MGPSYISYGVINFQMVFRTNQLELCKEVNFVLVVGSNLIELLNEDDHCILLRHYLTTRFETWVQPTFKVSLSSYALYPYGT